MPDFANEIDLAGLPFSGIILLIVALAGNLGVSAKWRPIVAIVVGVLLLEIQGLLMGQMEPIYYFNRGVAGLAAAASASGLFSWVKQARR